MCSCGLLSVIVTIVSMYKAYRLHNGGMLLKDRMPYCATLMTFLFLIVPDTADSQYYTQDDQKSHEH